MFINCFSILQQKFNHFIAFVLNILKIRYIIIFQIYNVMKINYMITDYNIITERSFIISAIERAHFKLHTLKSFSNMFQNTVLFYAKRK